ncbi:MAG: metallophosphoesterase [Acidobacteriota bacterium]
MLSSWIFNLILAAGEVVLLRPLIVQRDAFSLRRLSLRLVGVALLAGLLAGLLGMDPFGMLRLLAWAIFLHGTALAALAGWLLWYRSRLLAGACLAIAVILPAIAFNAFRTEPYRLEVTTHRISAPGLTKPVTIVLIADLQTDHLGDYERMALIQAMELHPDLLLLAGDYVQLPPGAALEATQRELNAYLKEIGFAAPLGIYAVEGNTDPPGWERAFEGLSVRTVRSTSTFDLGEIRLTALSLAASFNQSLALPPAPEEAFHIALGHGPDFALSPDATVDLLLAGHIHGGQVQIPGFGPLITLSAVPQSWSTGRTELPTGGTLVVSRGIGMERGRAPRLRFFCRPELVVLELVPPPGASAQHRSRQPGAAELRERASPRRALPKSRPVHSLPPTPPAGS